MKNFLEWCKTWVKAHPGSTVLLFALTLLLLGWSLGLLTASAKEGTRGLLLEVATAVGTIGAAVAAFQAVRLTRLDHNARANQEREARRPYLVISQMKINDLPERERETARVFFSNLGRYPVHVTHMIVDTDELTLPEIFDVGILIPPGATGSYEETLKFRIEDTGELRFYFHYSPTEQSFHRINVPFVRRFKNVRGAKLYTQLFFALAVQTLEENVEDERSSIQAKWS